MQINAESLKKKRCQQLPKTQKKNLKLQKAAKIYQTLGGGSQKLPKVARNCQKLPTVAISCQQGKSWQKLLKVTQNCQKLPKVAKNGQRLPTIAKHFQSLPEVAKHVQKVGGKKQKGELNCFRTFSKVARSCQKLPIVANVKHFLKAKVDIAYIPGHLTKINVRTGDKSLAGAPPPARDLEYEILVDNGESLYHPTLGEVTYFGIEHTELIHKTSWCHEENFHVLLLKSIKNFC